MFSLPGCLFHASLFHPAFPNHAPARLRAVLASQSFSLLIFCTSALVALPIGSLQQQQ